MQRKYSDHQFHRSTNGTAVLTISAETKELSVPLEDMLRKIRQFPGVIKAEILAG